MIRLFAAIAVPGDVAEGLARHQQGLRGARWRAPEHLHITLRFAGDLPENQADDLDGELSMVSAPPLQLRLSGLGTFGARGDMHALWAGVEGGEALVRLAARCETAARRAGLKAETRVWRPHVTLAYLRGVEPASVAAWVESQCLLESPTFWAVAFGLYSSWRGEDGAFYRLERSYGLG